MRIGDMFKSSKSISGILDQVDTRPSAGMEDIEESVLEYKLQYKLLLRRFQHLLESRLIASYDEVDIKTGAYKKDILRMDEHVRSLEKGIAKLQEENEEIKKWRDAILSSKTFVGVDYVHSGKESTTSEILYPIRPGRGAVTTTAPKLRDKE